jgi:general secretion pathway protein C
VAGTLGMERLVSLNPLMFKVRDFAISQGPTCVAGLLALLFAYDVAVFSWGLIDVEGDNLVEGLDVSGLEKQVDNRPQSFAVKIASIHLFGKVDQKAPKKQTVIDAPETRLNFTLYGVIAGKGDQSAAIIAEGKGAGNYYLIGDTMPGGAKLHEVYREKVILERSGRFETLSLPKEALKLIDQRTTPQSSAPIRQTKPSAGASRLLSRYQKQFAKNPKSIGQLARISPVTENGAMVGYRLMPGVKSGDLIKLGLRPGDVVTKVNGLSLASKENGVKVYNMLKKTNELTIEVQRGGRSQSFKYSIK